MSEFRLHALRSNERSGTTGYYRDALGGDSMCDKTIVPMSGSLMSGLYAKRWVDQQEY